MHGVIADKLGVIKLMDKREVYFDNSATTRAFDEVRDIVAETMTVDYGNTSSRHMKGVEAENYIKTAREEIAKTLKVKDKEILFTSGGTESNNMALIGTALANKRAGNHIITSCVEHASIYNTTAFLEELGFRVTYLPVDHNGHVSLDALREAICDDTILVSVMYVNNEIGAVEPIEEIAKIIKEKKPSVYFHVDAIQAYGKYVIRPKKQGIDLLSASGHKIHGPKGTGFLYIDEKVKIKPIIYGGGQQKGMRSGTENVPGAAALGEAAMEIYENFDEKIAHMYALKKHFIEEVTKIEGVTINGKTGEDSAPQIVSVTIQGVRSEVMLHSLEEKEVYVSAGSACSSNKPAPSKTLQGIGLKKADLEGTIRFSFCVNTTEAEIDYAIEQLKEIIPFRRKFTRH